MAALLLILIMRLFRVFLQSWERPTAAALLIMALFRELLARGAAATLLLIMPFLIMPLFRVFSQFLILFWILLNIFIIIGFELK